MATHAPDRIETDDFRFKVPQSLGFTRQEQPGRILVEPKVSRDAVMVSVGGG